jgi:hypothetical protein
MVFFEVATTNAPRTILKTSLASCRATLSRLGREHYSHIRMEAKRKALEVLAPVLAVESELSAVGPRVH